MSVTLSPLHQLQAEQAIADRKLSRDDLPRAVSLLEEWQAQGRPADLAEAIAEVARLKPAELDELRRLAKVRLATQRPDASALPPEQPAPAAPPVTPAPAGFQIGLPAALVLAAGLVLLGGLLLWGFSPLLPEAARPDRSAARGKTSPGPAGPSAPAPESRPGAKPLAPAPERAPEARCSLAGLVTDQEQKPLAGALVTVVSTRAGRTIETDARGTFQLADLAPGDYRIQVARDRYTGQTADASLDPRRPKQELRFTLAARPGLLLTVTDGPGGPAMGSFALQVARLSEDEGVERAAQRLFEKAAPGTLLELEPGRYELVAALEDKKVSAPLRLTLDAGERKEATLVLAAPALVRGRVQDGAGGQPVEKASLAVRRLGIGTASGAEGQFELRLPPGEWVLEVAHASYAWQVVAVPALAAGEQKDLGALELGHGRRLRARVLNSAGRPLEGVPVLVSGRSGYSEIHDTGAEGRFETRELPDGHYVLAPLGSQLSKSVYLDRDWKGEVVLGGEHGLDLRVVVTDAGRMPVAGAQAMAFRKEKGELPLARASTDARGVAHLQGLPGPGDYVLMVGVPAVQPHSPGNLTTLVRVVTVERAGEVYDIRLAPQDLTGVVVQAGARPVAGVRVQLLPAAGGKGTSGSATTDGKGEFRVRHLPAGTYTLLAQKDGFSAPPQEVNVPGANVTIELERAARPGHLAVEVTGADGRPVAALVILHDAARRPVRAAQRTDGAGRLTLRDLAPGEYHLSAQGEADTLAGQAVTVTAGETTRAKLSLPARPEGK